jgi:hypothetical protein
MYIILDTWEAEFGRFGAQFEASLAGISWPHLNQRRGAVAHTCHPRLCKWLGSGGWWFQAGLGAGWRGDWGDPISIEKSWVWWFMSNGGKPCLGKKQESVSKITRVKRAGGMAQHKVLSSNPCTTKNKNNGLSVMWIKTFSIKVLSSCISQVLANILKNKVHIAKKF